MATKITRETRLKRGDIVRVFGKILGTVVRHEKFLKQPGYYAFNSSPGDRGFTKENGIDWYTRMHFNDLTRNEAEIITRDELFEMYKKEPTNELKVLLQMTKKRKSSK